MSARTDQYKVYRWRQVGEEVHVWCGDIREGTLSLRTVKSVMINHGKCWWGEGVWEIPSSLDTRIVPRT